ncbi:bifunctional cobalt-precorrin-7 (C(5))-methyltransferase/cobalt-precorrin-6B (C(15))-methyltransferase [Spirulina subsalsa]|uniref:bifunctional cobalt-precorrin-7 (C(5))-methyltransferase/cobalt-precorrin-6B (C(15))-methyltransferase n=1 Tax=Spirulina subsalsa TaxID=54311 RepID=UPI0002EE3668|nr:bifunctional cobalt-precorrin-7 (C(5))-methyltransferase/cobalt-precorrin-6B (C(15))-methyltransferase [Spirulina subsalsa]
MTDHNSQSKWLSIIGIGEDGLEGLSPVGRSLLSLASVIVGGERHLAMLPPEDRREKLLWTSPLQDSLEEIMRRRGQAVCVLASGDPMCYGIGVTLTRHIPLAEMTIIPAPSAFSLACSRLGWSLSEVETLSLCGRPPALLNGVLYPGAQLLVLSADAQTPAMVCQMLTEKGFGESPITVLEHLGSPKERHLQGIANRWDLRDIAALNVIAITCVSSHPLTLPPRLPGLPDSAYQHDGQLTKRQVRAVTLATLAPLPGQLLWDVGAGCGSIGIEWMRCDRRCQSIAIEHHPTRLQYIADNATALGTPHLKIVAGKAPQALHDLPQPDAIFIGGGITTPDLLETCWAALPEGGRLVCNTVTVESELILLQWQRKLGGELTRISIQKAEPVGQFLGWKAMAPVTQWVIVKQAVVNPCLTRPPTT